MRVKKMIAAATLPAMIASPVVAASDNPASSLSLRGDSDASQPAQSEPPAPVPVPPVEAASTGGIPTALIIGGVVVAAVVVGALLLGHNDHNNHPASA